MPLRLFLISVFLMMIAGSSGAQTAPPDLILHGTVRASENHTYFQVPFAVPPHTHRITVEFENLGAGQHTVLDLGMADPYRFRGASGGNKHRFTISETDATPSYLPGAIPPGRWKLLIGVPNIRPGVRSTYRAEIWFNSELDDSSFTFSPLNANPGWYRGDLHMHAAHSDGSCPSETGKPVPCPLFLTAEAAVHRGLDFIAITDHNTTSQYDDERELQPYFDKLLFIPGRELTTFYGHANEWGTARWIDYRVGTPAVPDVNATLRGARKLGAIVSINHPELPDGELCMGCGWDPSPPADMKLVTSVEVVNGDGTPATHFWEDQLRRGYRLTAVGGSDNHHATWPPDHPASIGYPTTVIYAPQLSVSGILSGIRSGRVFIDLTGLRDRILDLSAANGSSAAEMGGALAAPSGDRVSLQLEVAGCSGGQVRYFVDGSSNDALPPQLVATSDATLHAAWISDGRRHWIRAEVHDSAGRLILLGNPVYINWPSPSPRT